MDDAVLRLGARLGGSQQRKRAALQLGFPAADSQSCDTGSALVGLLLELFAWGMISGVLVQELAHADREDGNNADEIIKLSAVGCNGVHSGNCARDIRDTYKIEATKLPTPYIVNLPMSDSKRTPPQVVLGLAPMCVVSL